MAKLELQARVHFVGDIKVFPSKNDPNRQFTRRALYLDTTTFDQYTGQRNVFEKFPMIEFNNKNSALLDNAPMEEIENAFSKVEPNDVVRVSIDITGRFYDSPDGDMIPDYMGNIRPRKHFNAIEGYEITIVHKNGQGDVISQRQQAQPMAQQQQVAQPMMGQQSMPQAPMMGQPMMQQGYQHPQQGFFQQANNGAPF